MPYEEYFKAASEGLIVVDIRGRIVEANPQAERLFGYSRQELVGQPIELLVPERLRDEHRKDLRGYFNEPRTRAMGLGLSLAALRKNGTEFPVEISLTYAKATSRGDLVVAAVTDITERLALEDQARRAETLASLGTLAAGIAHDLNNPLQVIRSRAELLLEGPGTMPASEMKEDHETIHRQAQRASQIVNDFLEFARRNGRAAVSVDVNELVEHSLLLLGGSMRGCGIAVEAKLEKEAPRIMGHPVALERVLVNLLTNARDAMPQGGSVKIGVKHLEGSPDRIRLTVTDDGPGIPPENLGKLFDLFYTTKQDGTGLGLWLSRRIISEHGGKIEVASELGKGTTFAITLPTSDTASFASSDCPAALMNRA